jgi:hypothetical protein
MNSELAGRWRSPERGSAEFVPFRLCGSSAHSRTAYREMGRAAEFPKAGSSALPSQASPHRSRRTSAVSMLKPCWPQRIQTRLT